MAKKNQTEIGEAYDVVSEKVINSESHYSHLASLANGTITEKSNVLDAGCGNGFLIEKLANNALYTDKNITFHAFDASLKMIQNLEGRLDHVNLSQQFLPSTSYEDNFF